VLAYFARSVFFYVWNKKASKEENRITLIQEKEECF
jgi:hypothetical protein